MRTVTCLIVGGLLLWGASNPVWAEEPPQEEPRLCPICTIASDDTVPYQNKAGSTFLRGALNTTLGWTEMIRQPAKEAKAGGNVLIGVANGVGQSVARTATGLAELFTFWTPKVEGRYIHFAKDCPLDTN